MSKDDSGAELIGRTIPESAETEPRLNITLQQAKRLYSAMMESHGKYGGDHACSRCYADVQPQFRGFVCVKHRLEDFIAKAEGRS